jgi:hypothetical protein
MYNNNSVAKYLCEFLIFSVYHIWNVENIEHI